MTSIEFEDTDYSDFTDEEADTLWEGEDDTEDYDDAEASPADRRRQRQQRIAQAQARRRRALARIRAGAGRTVARRAVPARPTPQQAVAAIKNLDLETKIQDDTLRRAISGQKKRMNRSEYAAVAGAATNQLIESFDGPDNPYLKAALRFAPLLLLSPQQSGSGAGGLLKDPRVLGGAAVLGIAFAGENRDRFTRPREVILTSTNKLATGERVPFAADVYAGGRIVKNATVKWTSSDDNVARVGNTGIVEARAAGTALITAEVDGVPRHVLLRVE